MKRKKKQFKKTKASRNALSGREPKKRFGKKQKKKLLIIAIIAFVALTGLSVLLQNLQAKKVEAENKAKKGEVITKQADKKNVDDDGNPIITHKNTEIHIIDVGDGNAALIKKGRTEILVDAGSKKVADYIEKHVDGNLEYLIITNDFEGSTQGIKDVEAKFKIDNYIYSNISFGKGAEANGQSIDLGENTSVTISPGVGGPSDMDKTAIVTVSDEDKTIYITGQSSAKNLNTLKGLSNESSVLIIGGKPNLSNTPSATMKAINPSLLIASTKTKLSSDFVDAVNQSDTDLYTTYKSGDIVLTVENSDITLNIDSESQIREEADNYTKEEKKKEEEN